MKYEMQLVDQSRLNLNPTGNPHLQQHLDDPKSQVAEMIRQVNAAQYYGRIFEGQNLVFLDLGANLGVVSLYAAPHCRRVVAVEAEPDTFGYLQTLVSGVRLGNIECLHAALAPKSGPVKIAVDSGDYSCHTVTNPKPGAGFLQVPGVTLADILTKMQLSSVDVCKVDVEGSEMESLTEAVFEGRRVVTWYIEVHKTPTLSREQSLAMMLARMWRAGYDCEVRRHNAIVGRRK